MASENFKIIYTGNISPSVDRQQVIAKFARLFRIDDEKAGNILNRDKPVTLLKKVAHEKAYSIKSTLTELGIAVEMERVTSLAHDSNLGLTPVDPNFSTQPDTGNATSFHVLPGLQDRTGTV